MDLELELDDELLATMERAAQRAGMTPEEWARTALRIYLGLATRDEQRRLGQRVRAIDPL